MQSEAQKHLSNLGKHAEDKVSGFKGIIVSITFDINGCIQGFVKPKVNKEGLQQDGNWFDLLRLTVTGKPVMQLPNFVEGPVAEGRKGAAEKSAPSCG